MQPLPPGLSTLISIQTRKLIEGAGIVRLKVPEGLAAAVVTRRELRQVYETNRDIKAFGLFLCLKSLTTSGTVQRFHSQMEYLTHYCKCSRSTFLGRLALAQELGLLTRDRHNIYLAGFDAVCRRYGIVYTRTHSIKYDTDNIGHTAEWLLKAIEIKENKHRQHEAVRRQLSENPILRQSLLDTFGIADGAAFRQELLALQQFSFTAGTNEGELLHRLNADDNRSVPALRRAHGFKSGLSVYYLKRGLERRHIADVQHRAYTARAGTWSKYFHTAWNRAAQLRTTFMPDNIRLNPAIFGDNLKIDIRNKRNSNSC